MFALFFSTSNSGYKNFCRPFEFPMANRNQLFWALMAGTLTVLGYMGAGYVFERSQWTAIVLSFVAAFIGYVLFIRYIRIHRLLLLLLVSGLFRLIFLWSEPTLSDDFYRFVWDGRIIEAGYSPYAHTPNETPPDWIESIDPNHELLENMNSPDYYSVYPPLHQAVFYVAAKTSSDLKNALVVMRLLLILADMLLIVLVFRIASNLGRPDAALLYALNPLVIIEISGNLHFEGLVALPLVLAVWWLRKKPVIFSGALLGIAAAIKFTPFIFLPAMLREKSRMQAIKLATLSFLCFAFTGWWLLSAEEIIHLFKSVRLYFQSFEFNASVYFLFREAGQWLWGYNLVAITGILVPALGTAIILWISFAKRAEDEATLFQKMVFVGFVYLLFATTVHPWYLIPMLALAVPTGLIFPWVWSALILLSYSAYSSEDYSENLLLIAMQYMVVLAMVWLEIFHPQKIRKWISLLWGDRT